MLAKWLRRLGWAALTIVVVVWLLPVWIVAAAWIGDKTGWYYLEDSMCTIPEGCEEYAARRKRLREMRTAPKSN
jgi:hypothetical protein